MKTRNSYSDDNEDEVDIPLLDEDGKTVWTLHMEGEASTEDAPDQPLAFETEQGYEYEPLLDEDGNPVLEDGEPVLKRDEFGVPILKLDKNGNPIEKGTSTESELIDNAGSSRSSPAFFFKFLLLLVSVYIIFSGLKVMLLDSPFGATAEGTVVRYRYVDDRQFENRSTNYMHESTYVFKDAKGTEHYGAHNQKDFFFSNNSVPKRGSKVTVRYLPFDPSVNRIGGKGAWSGFLMVGLGVIILILAIDNSSRRKIRDP